MLYFLLFFVILFLSESYGASTFIVSKKRLKNIYLIVFFGLFLLIGFRNRYVGTDTNGYVYEFINRIVPLNLSIFTYNEPLYKLALSVSQLLFNSYTGFLCFFAFPFSWAYANFVKKYSDDYFISVLIIIVLGTVSFCMAGVRQSVALGITIVAYQYAREHKLIPFLVCCLIAFGFHNSSIVIGFMYPLFYIKKIDFKFWLIFLVSFALGATKNPIIMTIASKFFTQERYFNYTTVYQSSLNYTMLIIQLAMLLFCYYYKDILLKNDSKNANLFVMAFISIVAQSFTPILGEFFRISLYFSFSFTILIPKVIALQKKSENMWIMYIGIIFVCFVYLLIARDQVIWDYAPFWR